MDLVDIFDIKLQAFFTDFLTTCRNLCIYFLKKILYSENHIMLCSSQNKHTM